MLSAGQWISLLAMMVSITAMIIQFMFGRSSQKRAERETKRQIEETTKQEKLHVLNAEENYKRDVRDWGRAVVRNMALAQQFCRRDKVNGNTPDFALARTQTVAALRGLLDKAKWLFPTLATPSTSDYSWDNVEGKNLSALETILHTYHVLDKVKLGDTAHCERSAENIRKLRRKFVREMRRAVDPQVRGVDIETLMAEIEMNEDKKTDAASDVAPIKDTSSRNG